MAVDDQPATTESQPVSRDDPLVMEVKIYAPFQVYFEGTARSLSAVNDVGPFDILPKHRNFMCMLVPCKIVIQTADNQQKSIPVNRALMHVKADRVVVFIDV